ncbi:MAG: hypothetical protein ACR2JD_08760 [Nocardioides sp.]
MLPLVIAMIVIVAIAAVVVAYVAYPHRGEEMPAVPWLGDAMSKAVDALPTVEPGPLEPLHPPADRPADERAAQPAGKHARG